MRLIPYQQKDEPPRRAGLIEITVPPESLEDKNIPMLKHLIDAVDCMNPVFVHQIFPATEALGDFIARLLEGAEEEDLRISLENYLTILRLQNGPWSHLPRKNHLLQAPSEKAKALAVKLGLEEEFARFEELLFDFVPSPKKANFYPVDLTEEEYDSLEDDGKAINTLVRRDPSSGELKTIRNESYYRSACEKAAAHLQEAARKTSDPWFRLYLEAKIVELKTGTEEARRVSDALWIRHNNPVDIILSTAIEQYEDQWKEIKGSATGAVMVTNESMTALINSILEKVSRLEAEAPWKLKREEIDPETLPKLKYTDVLSWAGDYVTGPLCISAQSLPNDEWLSKNIGTVNMVFTNVTKASFDLGTKMVAEEFLPEEIIKQYGEKLAEGHQLHAALHEIGHTTGLMDKDHPRNPQYYFEDEYSAMEETRAELFAMWSADRLMEWGVLEEETVMAAHYAMFASLINTLSYAPDQAHYKARNMMSHFFRERGGILVKEGAQESLEDRSTIFEADFPRLRKAIEEMLARIADIKSAGNKDAMVLFREQYCYTDPLKEEIEKRTKHIPLGKGLIFPDIITMEYPEFTEQKKFSLRFPFG